MASTRKSSRPTANKNDINSPPAKRLKPENNTPLMLVSSPVEDVDIEVDDCETVVVDCSAGDLMEEVVVTVDDGQLEIDVEPTPMATVLVPGGAITEGRETPESNLQERQAPMFTFKDPTFIHSSKGPGGNKKTRIWKNLKQIVAAERSLPWGPDDVTYGSIDAPPSFKPAKKYSDISGLEARYTDPQTKLRFANSDEYRRVHILPGDVITGCLQLRKAKTLVP